jgi:hypothetical protein
VSRHAPVDELFEVIGDDQPMPDSAVDALARLLVEFDEDCASQPGEGKLAPLKGTAECSIDHRTTGGKSQQDNRARWPSSSEPSRCSLMIRRGGTTSAVLGSWQCL